MLVFRESAKLLLAGSAAAISGVFAILGPLIASTPAEASPTSREFNIIWGINTQIESLADPTSQDRSQINQLQSLVDGYSLNVLPGGPLSYWPSRPDYCALRKASPRGEESNIVVDNVKYSVASLRTQCDQLYQRYLDSLHGREQQLVFSAISRVIRNLNLAAQHEAGRSINAQTIVSAKYFSYAPASDAITINSLPSLDLLAKNGIIADSLFIYQEKTRPEEMLQVPMAPEGGDIGYLPDNTRIVGMINSALHRYGHPVRELDVNLRIWRPAQARAMVSALDAAAAGYTVGITFEHGPAGLYMVMRNGETRVENIATGIAWLIGNTNNPVSVLIPAYWPCEGDTCAEMNNEETRAALISELDTYIIRLDRDLRADGEGSGLCTGRLSLIPGGYGSPMHPRILPIHTPSGKLAGTVGGEIVELHNLRTRLCG